MPGGALNAAGGVLNVVCVLFDGFELLDAAGPLELFSCLNKVLRVREQSSRGLASLDDVPERVRISTLSLGKTNVARSSMGPNASMVLGPAMLCDFVLDTSKGEDGSLPGELPARIDVLLVPGGSGVREIVTDAARLRALRRLCESPAVQTVMTVCTGSAALAASGVLDNVTATSNKLAWDWVVQQGPRVKWLRRARYHFDGRWATSSGVAAGMDLAVALIERLLPGLGLESARVAEYVSNLQPDNDPFA
jgi:putative intracellular protease/amidase